jgi:hypothetical protein
MKLLVRSILALVASLAFGAAATGQTLTFTAESVTGVESVVPKLTWSTSPAATSCLAGGDWSGNKAASGTETLAAITASKTYNMTCTWPSGTQVVLTWVAPTTNTDGSTLSNLKGYLIYAAATEAGLATATPRNHFFPSSNTTPYTGLTAGTWFFCMKAVNAVDVASACSNSVSKTLTAGTANRSVGIVVNPRPNPPTALTVE